MSSIRRRTGPITDRRTIRERLARAATLIGEEPRPTPEQARAVLEERARALARVPVQPPPTSLVLDVVTFSLANEDYAIELGYVHKIVPLIELTPVPGRPTSSSASSTSAARSSPLSTFTGSTGWLAPAGPASPG